MLEEGRRLLRTHSGTNAFLRANRTYDAALFDRRVSAGTARPCTFSPLYGV
jgi:hypothetical protein